MDGYAIANDRFYMTYPFSAMIVGSSGSGKSTWVRNLIKNWQHAVPNSKGLKRLRLVYSVYQEIYDDLISYLSSDCIVETMSEIPLEKFKSDEYWEMPNGDDQILILDDIMAKALNNRDLAEIMETLYTIRSHHNSLALISCAQDLFRSNQSIRSCLRNTNYIIITPSFQNMTLLVSLQKQLFAGKPGILTEAAKLAFEVDEQGYLVLDSTVGCNPNYRIKSGLFPNQLSVAYVSS